MKLLCTFVAVIYKQANANFFERLNFMICIKIVFAKNSIGNSIKRYILSKPSLLHSVFCRKIICETELLDRLQLNFYGGFLNLFSSYLHFILNFLSYFPIIFFWPLRATVNFSLTLFCFLEITLQSISLTSFCFLEITVPFRWLILMLLDGQCTS